MPEYIRKDQEIQEAVIQIIVECLTSRDCIKEAFKLGLITEEEGYLTLLECRNLTSHTYNLATAEIESSCTVG